jgi:hypothetical protein
MKSIVNKLTSRKLWIAVGSIIAILVAWQTGQVNAGYAINAAVVIVLGYLGVQGFADYKAVQVSPPPPLPFTVEGAKDQGLIVSGEIAPGVELTLSALPGQNTDVRLMGKKVQDLQFPKDFLPLLGKLKL